MRRKAVLTAAAFLAAIGLSATRASAQGFSVYEHDACSMGRAGAGVAAPCSGGSAIFFNPAGIVTGERNKWNCTVLKAEYGQAVSVEQFAEAFKKGKFDAVVLVHSETSTATVFEPAFG